MECVNLYKCLCDGQRVRILSLLNEGPLCVCHLVEILQAEQVKVSKQLKYMKELGVVEGQRQAQWMIYSLKDPENLLLKENLKCLQKSSEERITLLEDLKKRTEIVARLCEEEAVCAPSIC